MSNSYFAHRYIFWRNLQNWLGVMQYLDFRLESQSFLYLYGGRKETHIFFHLLPQWLSIIWTVAAFQPQMIWNNGLASLEVKHTNATLRRAPTLTFPPSPYFLIKFLNTAMYVIPGFLESTNQPFSQAL